MDYRDRMRLGRSGQFAVENPPPGAFVHAFLAMDGTELVRTVCNSAEACVISRWLHRNGWDWKEDCYQSDF